MTLSFCFIVQTSLISDMMGFLVRCTVALVKAYLWLMKGLLNVRWWHVVILLPVLTHVWQAAEYVVWGAKILALCWLQGYWALLVIPLQASGEHFLRLGRETYDILSGIMHGWLAHLLKPAYCLEIVKPTLKGRRICVLLDRLRVGPNKTPVLNDWTRKHLSEACSQHTFSRRRLIKIFGRLFSDLFETMPSTQMIVNVILFFWILSIVVFFFYLVVNWLRLKRKQAFKKEVDRFVWVLNRKMVKAAKYQASLETFAEEVIEYKNTVDILERVDLAGLYSTIEVEEESFAQKRLLDAKNRIENQLESHFQGSVPVPVRTLPTFIAEIVVVEKVGEEEIDVHAGVCFRHKELLLTSTHVLSAAGNFQRTMVKWVDARDGTVFKSEVNFYHLGYDLSAAMCPLGWPMGSCKLLGVSRYQIACATNGTDFTMGRLEHDDADEFGMIAYKGTTHFGWSGSPYYVHNTVYGMHTTGGKVNFGLEGSFIKTLLKRGERSSLAPFKDEAELAARAEQEQIPETSADWLFDQLDRKKGKLKIQRGLDEVRFWADGMYHVMDREEFDEAYDLWQADQDDRYEEEREREYDEERHHSRGRRQWNYYDDDDEEDAARAGYEAFMPQADDSQPKNLIGASAIPAHVLESSSALACRNDKPKCLLTDDWPPISGIRTSTEYPELTAVLLSPALNTTCATEKPIVKNRQLRRNVLPSVPSLRLSQVASTSSRARSKRPLETGLSKPCATSIRRRRRVRVFCEDTGRQTEKH